MSDFKTTLKELQQKQEELNAQKEQLRYQAINEVQHLINEFNIQQDEISFDPKKAITRRGSAKIKYRFPDGTYWTGRGNPKKAVLEYLKSVGESLSDLEKYKVQEEKSE